MRIATNSGKIDISKEDKTFNLANFFANFITEGDVIFLYGEIGVGKTIEGSRLLRPLANPTPPIT